MEQTIRCPICGDPHKVFAFYAGDQSACQDCIAKAERKRKKEWQLEVDKAVERLTRSSNAGIQPAERSEDRLE